jgi:hypothetical protein
MKHLLSAPLEFLNDFHGGKSSKRFWGNRLLTIGVFLALILYVANFITPIIFGRVLPITVDNNCYDIAQLFMGAGGGLLFGGVFENLGKKK